MMKSGINVCISNVMNMTAVERKSDFKLTTDTPYLALPGEPWGVHCEKLGENRPRYNGTALYLAVCRPWI